MNKKLSVLRRITAVVLCVTLLSSQVVVANAEDSERMNVQTNSEITDISEQDGFSSDTSEISDITESDIPDSFLAKILHYLHQEKIKTETIS